MKIFVICDKNKNIQSIAAPNPLYADQISMIDDENDVRELDINEDEFEIDSILKPRNEEERDKVYEIIRKLL